MAENGSDSTLEAAMRGVLALMVDEREARVGNDRSARKTELLLADAGLSIGEIASLLDKKYDAVAKTISRGRAK
jgi:DNA-directed RNA polymerase specialized sigma24 family protein